MDIRKRLNDKKVAELKSLAKSVGLQNYSTFKKQELIDFILDQKNEQEISAAIDKKPSFLKRIKDYTHIYGIITTVALIGMVIIFFYQECAHKKEKKKVIPNTNTSSMSLTDRN